jgi:hypothetical protein
MSINLLSSSNSAKLFYNEILFMRHNYTIWIATLLVLTLAGCKSDFQSSDSLDSSKQTNDPIDSPSVSRAEFEKFQESVTGVFASLSDRFTDLVIMNAELKIELRKLHGQPTQVTDCTDQQHQSTLPVEHTIYAYIPSLITFPISIKCKSLVGEQRNFELSLVDESNLLYLHSLPLRHLLRLVKYFQQ